jgi:hypothetical protein
MAFPDILIFVSQWLLQQAADYGHDDPKKHQLAILSCYINEYCGERRPESTIY